MVPHMSGTTLDAQHRYATGAKEILRRHLAGEEQDPANLIVQNGDVSSCMRSRSR
jgi:formate dehydrogenase